MPTDFDRQLDRAIRSMLDVDPPRALRARVLASLEQPGRRTVSFARWAAVAAAAAVALGALIAAPWHTAAPPIVSSAQVHDVPLPASVTPALPRVFAAIPAASRPSSQRGAVHAAVLAANDVPAESGVTALERPAALSVTTIAPPVTSTLPSIQPAPLRVSALELPALEMPPDAARGADR
ncbi:MAG TPA: hypothetical protein VL484_17495 [Vicinamibacterales bacterium]|jgi:hypothetical protein|nr:hypothetical protein [Vicinamibacterales bacterium]